MSDGKKLTAEELFLQLTPQALDFRHEAENLIRIWEAYATESSTPEDDPFFALRVFNLFTGHGIYPPEPILKWLSTSFTKLLPESTDRYRRTLDERLGIQGPKKPKKRLQEFRDSSISRDFHILTTHFNASAVRAAEAIINKYSNGTTPEECFPGFMVDMWRDVVGMPESSEMVIKIYNDYKKKYPEQFKETLPVYSGFPSFYTDNYFLGTFVKEDVTHFLKN